MDTLMWLLDILFTPSLDHLVDLYRRRPSNHRRTLNLRLMPILIRTHIIPCLTIPVHRQVQKLNIIPMNPGMEMMKHGDVQWLILSDAGLGNIRSVLLLKVD